MYSSVALFLVLKDFMRWVGDQFDSKIRELIFLSSSAVAIVQLVSISFIWFTLQNGFVGLVTILSVLRRMVVRRLGLKFLFFRS